MSNTTLKERLSARTKEVAKDLDKVKHDVSWVTDLVKSSTIEGAILCGNFGDAQIAEIFRVSIFTVMQTRVELVEAGLYGFDKQTAGAIRARAYLDSHVVPRRPVIPERKRRDDAETEEEEKE